jgi:hypothetical protein
MNETSRNRLAALRARGREEMERNPLYKLRGWTAAHTRLLEILPNARTRIDAPFCMLPDPILEEADKIDALLNSVILLNSWRGDPSGFGDKDFENYENLELFDLVFAERPPAPGPLWFVPDNCFGSHEPYLVFGEHLRTFVAACRCQLTQDTLFIWCETPRIAVIHHSGAFFHITNVTDQKGSPTADGMSHMTENPIGQ